MTDLPAVLKVVVESSAQLSAWALAVGGGSVLVVVSTSYRRPVRLAVRLPYLLFFPGWAFLGYALYLGNVLSGKYLATLMVKADQIHPIASQINDIYGSQRSSLLCALTFFAAWLLIYLLRWVFEKKFHEEKMK